MKILILAMEDNCTAQMARGWLLWFDKKAQVVTAGIKKAGALDPKAVMVMKDAGIDISDYPCRQLGALAKQNWDFVISTGGEELKNIANITGWVGGWFCPELPDPSEQTGPEEEVRAGYLTARNEIRDRLFDFFLRQVMGKEILGADSCGAECDW